MSGAAIADFAMKAIQGISGGILADAQANADNIINDANTAASNLIRGANNELAASRSTLRRFNQSVNNNRALTNTGRNVVASNVDAARAAQANAAASFEDQIAFAEQQGAQSAMAAFTGLSGGVVDLVNGATALRHSRVVQRAELASKEAAFDSRERAKQLALAGWDSLDTSDVGVLLDRGQDVAQHRARGSNLFIDALSGQSAQGMANATAGASQFASSAYNGVKSFFNFGNYTLEV